MNLKKYNKLAILLAFFLFLNVENILSQSKDNYFDSATLHIAKDNVNCLYGLKNMNNEWVIKPSFDYIRENYADQRFFNIGHHSKSGIIRKDGKYFIEPIYDEIRPVQYYSPYGNTLRMFAKNDYFIIVKGQLNGLFCPQTNAFTIPFCNLSFKVDKHFLVVSDSLGLKGLADSSAVILKPQFNTLYEFNENSSQPVFVYSFLDYNDLFNDLDSNVFGLVHINGNFITQANYAKFEQSSFSDKSFWAIKRLSKIKTTQFDLINHKGDVLVSRNDPNPELSFSFETRINGNERLALVNCIEKDLIVNARGEIVAEGNKNAFQLLPYLSNTAKFIFKSKDLYGLKNETGKIVIKEMYKKFIPFLVDMDENKKQCFIAQKEGKYGLVDDKNKVLHSFKYDDIFIYEEVLVLVKDSNVSFLNKTNLTVPKYPVRFENGLALICKESDDENDLCGLIDRKFKIVLFPEYAIKKLNASTWFFSNETVIGRVNFDSIPHIEFLNDFADVGTLKYGYTYAITRNGNAALITNEFKIIGDTSYAAISDLDPLHEVFWVKKYLSLPEESEEEDFSFDFFESSNWGLKNLKGELIFDAVIDFPNMFLNGRAIVSIGGKFGMINHYGQTIIPFNYDSLFYGDTDRVLLYNKGKYGLADWNGVVLVEPQFDDISSSLGDYILVMKNGILGILSKTAEYVPNLEFHLQKYKIRVDSLLEFKETYLSNMNDFAELNYYENENLKEIIDSLSPNNSILSSNELCYIMNHFGMILLTNYLYNNSSYLPYNNMPELHYSSIYTRNTYQRYWGNESSSTYKSIDLHSVNNKSISYSITTTISDFSPWSEGHSRSKFQFLNYTFDIDTLRQIGLKELFVPNFKNTLNALFLKALKELDAADIDCKNPSKLLENLDKAFAITKEGIVFYINPSGDYDDEYYEFDDPVVVLITFEQLKPISKKNGILARAN
jgi:hypothetical protein